jgi:integrase
MSVKERTQKTGKKVFDVRVQYNGIRISKTVPTTMTDAKRVESKILQDLIHGKFEILKKSNNPTFKQSSEEYKKSVTFQKGYRNVLTYTKHLNKFFGKKRLTEISSQDFINYRTLRLKEVSPATVNRERSFLYRVLNAAVKSDDFMINKNPIKEVRPLKEPPAENRVLTLEEYQKLLDSAPEYFSRILFFACNTGMRLMEILNLKFGQIKRYLRGAEVELLDTKSGKKEYVPLNEEVVDLLLDIAKGKGIDLQNLKEKHKKKNVFTGMRGQRLQSVRKPMARTFKEAGIEKRPFHTFRHFWTKMMFDAGVDPYTIMKIGRWRDLETMIKYCFTTRPEEHEAVNRLSLHLNKKPSEIIRWQYSGKADN